MSILTDALLITAVGMGLVFIALLLLWGLMELMMRLTRKSAEAEAAEAEEEEAEEEEAPAVEAVDMAVLRRRAAAAAVAVALAAQPKGKGKLMVGPVETTTGAWQAVQRSTQLNRRSLMYSRKQRSSVR